MRLRRTGADPIRYDDVVGRLRQAYDAGAAERDVRIKPDWKLDERAAFLDRLRAAQARTLLEVGAGTGQDSAYFAAEGLTVTAVDLSPEMVARTRAKGVPAYVRDLLHLGFPAESFDAVYSVNALLHVPNADLAEALREIHAVLKPGGLFYLGVFGGAAEEGIAVEDRHVPARFFAFRTDRELLGYARERFEILDFHVYAGGDVRFQSLTLVRP
jgi:SAM-dependent methyltransferase